MTRAAVTVALAALLLPRIAHAQRMGAQTFAALRVSPCEGDPPPAAWLREVEVELREHRVITFLPDAARAQIREELRVGVRGMRCDAGAYELSLVRTDDDGSQAVYVSFEGVPGSERPRVAALRLAELLRVHRAERARRATVEAAAHARAAAPDETTRPRVTFAVMPTARLGTGACGLSLEAELNAGPVVDEATRVLFSFAAGGCLDGSYGRMRATSVERLGVGVEGALLRRAAFWIGLGSRVELGLYQVEAQNGVGLTVPTAALRVHAEVGFTLGDAVDLVAGLSVGYHVIGAEVVDPSWSAAVASLPPRALTIAGPFATLSLGVQFGLSPGRDRAVTAPAGIRAP